MAGPGVSASTPDGTSSRRSRLLIAPALLLVVALVAGGVAWYRSQGQVERRADDAVASVPGVRHVRRDDGVREAVLTAGATPAQVLAAARALQEHGPASYDEVGSGAATMRAGFGLDETDAELLLRSGKVGGTVDLRVDGAGGEVSALVDARDRGRNAEVLRDLAHRLVVDGRWASGLRTINVRTQGVRGLVFSFLQTDRGSVSDALGVVDAAAGLGKYRPTVEGAKGRRVVLRADREADVANVWRTATRAVSGTGVSRLEVYVGRDAGLTTASLSVLGSPGDDPAAAVRLARRVAGVGAKVSFVTADLSILDIDLPRVGELAETADLARSILPSDASVALRWTSDADDEKLSARPAVAARMAPRVSELVGRGYGIDYAQATGNRPGTLTFVPPDDANPYDIGHLGARLKTMRSLAWAGTVRVEVSLGQVDGCGDDVRVTLTSTSTGRAQKVDPDSCAAAGRLVRRAWSSSAG